jgi:putative copper export protein
MPGSVPLPPLVDIVTEVLYYLGLSVPLGVGVSIVALAIPEARGGVVAAHVRKFALPAAVFVAFTAALQFVASVAKYAKTTLPAAMDQYTIAEFLGSPASKGNILGQGTIALMQCAGYLMVVVALLVVGARGSRLAAGVLAAVSVVTAMIPDLPIARPTADGLAHSLITLAHILGALFWIGGLVVLAAAGLMDRRARQVRAAADDDDAGRAAQDWIQVWERFTVVALFAVGALIVSGTWLAWIHVGSPAQLLTTPYGRYLAIKLVIVIVMLGAGAYNVRTLIPRILAAQRVGDQRTVFEVAVRHFPVVVFGESLLVVGVLVVVPFLRGSARTQAGWPGAGPFDLSVFGAGVALIAVIAVAMWWGTRTPAALRSSTVER